MSTCMKNVKHRGICLACVAVVLLASVGYVLLGVKALGSWTSMANVPYGGGVFYGGSLAWTGGDYIYAFVGGGTPLFYRYSISGNSWTPRANMLTSVNPGGSLVWTGGDYIYAFAGGTNPYLFRYSISGNSWKMMNRITYGPGPLYGASLVWTGDDYIYAFVGNVVPYFHRYSISGDSWTYIGNTPFTQLGGADLVWTGGNYLYAFEGGNTPRFYRYDILGDTWTYISNCPTVVSYGGSLVWTGGDYIYALIGRNSPLFYRYSIVGNSWASMPSVGPSVSYGGCLEYAYRHIYAFPGNNQQYFRRYTDSDVAVIDVSVSDTEVFEGEAVNVTVAVKNEGTSPETFNVTAYYNAEPIGNQTVMNLFPGNQTELVFSWNTTGVASGTYTISAEAETLPDEIYVADNTFIDGEVVVHYVRVYWNPTCPPPFVASSIPRKGEPVNVTANILVNGNIPAEVLLFCRADGGAWWNTTMIYNASNSLWTTIMLGQIGNTTVEFYIEAYEGENTIVTPSYFFEVQDLFAGDVNGDGKVRVDDILMVALEFGLG
ncbi:MAG: hypothetical protein OEX77_01625 [Candidatus Bathyarchaeota archaeon]|nr:hypothetical protein [Candidatus Bathyarchaeota archaeon]MDH5733135.1 hypothetical protein [Candidatus Bathyarchaeota archaeon]